MRLRRKSKRVLEQEQMEARVREIERAVAGQPDPELQVEPEWGRARPALRPPAPFYEDSTGAPYLEPPAHRPVVVIESPRIASETAVMAARYEEHLKAKSYDDDRQPERGTTAWALWWQREQLRNSGASPEDVRLYSERHALDRIDVLRAQEEALLHVTPADRRRSRERYWRPRLHEDILGGSRSYGSSRGPLAPYQPSPARAGR
jgi:hypothetical protein